MAGEKVRLTHTGSQIDAGIDAALNPDTVPEADSDALITSDAVAKVQQGFAPIETAATAANAYAIGDLLVWGGVLYKAKTAIAVSDSFTVGTNIETTTVADKLNNIDTEITPDTDTTINGLLKGNGSKVAQAVGDTDYATPAAVTATRQMLAPILADPAGQAVSAGDYFIYNGVLRKALQAITSAMTAATFTGATYSEAVSNGGLNALKSALLWTNTNPSAIFAETKISLDLTRYRFILICFNRSAGNVAQAGSFIFRNIISDSNIVLSGGNTIRFREVSILSDGIKIKNAYDITTYGTWASTASNNLLIPTEIYGMP